MNVIIALVFLCAMTHVQGQSFTYGYKQNSVLISSELAFREKPCQDLVPAIYIGFIGRNV
jgi:hypothetical protein